MKVDFIYQKFYLRIGLCGVFVLMWIVISQFMVDMFNTSWLYWIVCATGTITIMILFYKHTENSSWFNKAGSFEKMEAGYLLTLGKTYQFKDVKRLCAWRSNLYGTESWFLLIESAKKIKIVSRPLTKKQAFVNVDLYKIFNQILKDNPNLKKEKNIDGTVIPYFYSK